MELRTCIRCGESYAPNKWNQRFCGSKVKKTGCAWENCNSDRAKRRWKYNEKHRQYHRNYDKNWKKKARKLDIPYAQRQRKQRTEYTKTEKGRLLAKESRRRCIGTILECNRRRRIKMAGINGFHTNKQWEELKRINGFRCRNCGITENELSRKWEWKSWKKLTRDHIVPISRGGTDDISNIQPLCITCNSKKRNRPPIVVAVSGGMDPLHSGHIAQINEAKKLGDYLVVILNCDKWLVRKKGYALLDQETRADILRNLKAVDEVYIHESDKDDVCGALLTLKPNVFAKGGDRVKGNVPEESLCEALGIEIVYGVGGGKCASSSEIVDNACNKIKCLGV